MTTKEKLQMSMVLDAPSNVRRTKDGYLAANVRAARSGIQIYRGYEVGAPDKKEVRVYRPEDEVFHKDSLTTYPHKPITNDHPPVMVDSETWKKYAVGMLGESVARDGEFVVVPMALMDQEVIDDYKSGKRQLSMGYSCELVWDSGITPDGQEYDAVQREIRVNHLAVVAAARGGPSLKIGDDDETGDEPMTLKTMTVDSISVEMSDTAIQVVQKALNDRDSRLQKLESELKALKDAQTEIAQKHGADSATHKTELATKDAEIATLKKQVADAEITPAKLDQLVAERAEVVGAAKKIVGDKLIIDGKTISEIRRQVVDAYMGEQAKGWDDVAVTAAFNVIAKDAKLANGGGNPLADAITHHQPTADTRQAAYDAYQKELTERWKKPVAA